MSDKGDRVLGVECAGCKRRVLLTPVTAQEIFARRADVSPDPIRDVQHHEPCDFRRPQLDADEYSIRDDHNPGQYATEDSDGRPPGLVMVL